jgi:hypothetical protein
LLQSRRRRFPGALLRRIGVDNEVCRAGEVVEHEHLVREHEQDVRRPELIRRAARCQAWLHVAHHVVGKKAHQAAVKHGQGGQRRRAQAGLQCFYFTQGVIDLAAVLDGAVVPGLQAPAEHLVHAATGHADDRIAPPLFAALTDSNR